MFKPLLAGTINSIETIKYPVLASPKLDGIRCVILDGKAVSRNLKPIPNEYVRTILESTIGKLGITFDGELILSGNAPFQRTTSFIMSADKLASDALPYVWEYHVFDIASNVGSFTSRFAALSNRVKALGLDWLKIVPHKTIHNETQLLAFETECLAKGFEGVMVRSPLGGYKQGRSTEREGILLKLKRFADDEAKVVGVEPLYTNNNEATKDALGHTKRSSHKENKVAQDTLGSLVVEWKGIQFNIGTGFDSLTRAEIWGKREVVLGMVIKFKYQTTGVLEAPRFPVFLGFRASGDL